MRSFSWPVPALLGLALVVTGCSDPFAGRKTVSGKIMIAGQPLNDPDSTIYFEPLEGQTTTGGCKVVNGEYKMEKMDGLLPGKYLVRITSAMGGVPANDEAAAGPGSGGGTNILSKDRVPPEWNVASTKEVVVKADGENKFDFDIPNQVDPKKKDPKKKK
jgi:hypothetical protein